MKMMFPIVASKADRMIEFVGSKVGSEGLIELKEVFASYTTESIASVAFGLEVDCHGNPDNAFRKAGRAVFEPPAWENIKGIFAFSFENLAKFLNLSFTNKEVTKFFMNTVKDTKEYREKNNVERNDFFQLVMNILKTDKDFTFEEMAANCFIFFGAG
jgi:cytochrome P450 family 6